MNIISKSLLGIILLSVLAACEKTQPPRVDTTPTANPGHDILGFPAKSRKTRHETDPSTSTPPPPDKPNILFISIDDLNDWIEPLGGHPDAKTPNLNRLARRSVTFTRAYCPAPACNPSRTATMTGLAPWSTGIYYNNQPWWDRLSEFDTIPEFFSRKGYQTIGISKNFHGEKIEFWDAFYRGGANPLPESEPANPIPPPRRKLEWGPLDVPDSEMTDMKVALGAKKVLQRDHTQPLLLAVGIQLPHLKWYVPREYFQMHPLEEITLPQTRPDDLDDLPEEAIRVARPELDHRKILATNNWKPAVQAYLAAVSFADHCLGVVLDALEESDIADETIIVLWSDHGFHLGEKQHWHKFTLWEEATHIPVMIALPDMATAGEKSDRTVSLLDLYPTLVDLCGFEPPHEFDGRSLVPLLNNPHAYWPHGAVTVRKPNIFSVRTPRWRYIRYGKGGRELYDHLRDPHEWDNLANDPSYAEVIAKLKALLPADPAKPAPRDPTRSWTQRYWQQVENREKVMVDRLLEARGRK